MNKTIRILSVITIILTVFFTVFSPLVGLYYVSTYGMQWEDLDIADKASIILRQIYPALIRAAVYVITAVYLIVSAPHTKRYSGEIVGLVVNFGALPVIFAVISVIYTNIYVHTMTPEMLQYYSLFSSGCNSVINVLNFSNVLLIVALTLSIAEKVMEAKRSAEHFTEPSEY